MFDAIGAQPYFGISDIGFIDAVVVNGIHPENTANGIIGSDRTCQFL